MTQADISASRSTVSGMGVALIIIGLSLAALSGAQMKILAGELPVPVIVFFRFAGFFVLMAPLAFWRHGQSALTPPRPLVQMIRGALMGVSAASFVTGVQTVAFAEAIAILYVYPFIITLLAPIFLSERVRLVSWLGVCGGFLGVLLVMRPSAEGLINEGAGWIVLAGAAVAMQMILNRKLGTVADPILTSVWGALTAAGVVGLFAIPVWHAPQADHVPVLLWLAALAALSQTLIAFAFARSSAAGLAPFTYFEIVAAVAIGFVMFGTLPDSVSWIGILVIVASGVLVARAQSGRLVLRRTKI